MKKLVEFPLENGKTFVVEIEETDPTGGTVRVARPGEIVEKATETFENVLEKISPVTTTIIKQFQNMTSTPDEIEVEFGLSLNAKIGAIIASAGGSAHFNITLRWTRKED